MIEPVKIGNATLYCGDAREILPTLERDAVLEGMGHSPSKIWGVWTPMTSLSETVERKRRADLRALGLPILELTRDQMAVNMLEKSCADRLKAQRGKVYKAAAQSARTRGKHCLDSDPLWRAEHG